MSIAVDHNLQKYADTEKQWLNYLAYCEHGSLRKAAKVIGKDESVVRKSVRRLMQRAAAEGYSGAQIVKGVSTLRGAHGEMKGEWTKTRLAGMPEELAYVQPDPKKIVSTSTMTDGTGAVIAQWRKEKASDIEREEMWQAFVKELARPVERVEPTPLPSGFKSEDLLAAFPIGDHHHGMHAWAEETGDADYSLKISERLLRDSSCYLINAVPACATALIPVLGDFFHYDSFMPVTPKHKNVLDADSRFPKMWRVALRSIRHMITAALERHAFVHVICELGNHDPALSQVMAETLDAIYENEPRVFVDTNPGCFHYFHWHNNLIGTHHGDKAKAAELPGIMAADRSVEWGKTKHRLWMTGHVHHESRKDYRGCTVESFRVLPPLDAHAANHGYRSERGMKAIVFHKEFGEVDRRSVNPDMFKMAA